MNKTLFQKWCARWWLYAVYAIGILMLVLLIVRWGNITMQQRLMGILAVLVPLHVFEENTWPGGFCIQMNLAMRSPMPLRYPMCTWQDMFTNLAATVLVAVLALVPTTTGMVLLVCFFGIGESAIHTAMGILMLRKFRSQGKKTFYGPGSVSAYVTLLPLSIYSIWWITSQTLTVADCVVGIALIVFVIVGLIRIPQMISGRAKDPRYEFDGYEYFAQFMG